MKLILNICVSLFLLCACGDENAHKTADWYKQHRDVLKTDLKKCKGISYKNRENWCEAAVQANRELMGERIKADRNKSYY
ncbi:hypothetical protein GA0061082_10719 [Snodgrassella sp. R-53583]|nr:hypothetical protein GA0061082_10719 [Snodgrassella sp. R-53583]